MSLRQQDRAFFFLKEQVLFLFTFAIRKTRSSFPITSSIADRDLGATVFVSFSLDLHKHNIITRVINHVVQCTESDHLPRESESEVKSQKPMDTKRQRYL